MANANANENEQTSMQTAQTPPDGTNEGAPRGASRGPRAAGAKHADLDLEAIKAELRAEMKAEKAVEIAAIREEFREQLNDERAAFHAQVDSAKQQASEATAHARAQVKPADFGQTVLDGRQLMAHERPSERRASRPLPDKGVLEVELVHGSFVGSTMDKTYWPKGTEHVVVGRDKKGEAIVEPVPETDSHEPAVPGEILRFDMTNKLHRRSAQLLRDGGCCERI
jgi:hypothetical protein